MNAPVFSSPARGSGGAEVEIVAVTQELLQAFTRGELSPLEEEAMEAFLDDYPDLRREISGWPRPKALIADDR